MALAGKIGAAIDPIASTAAAFGEDQARYVVTTAGDVSIEGAVRIGSVGGHGIEETRDNGVNIPLADLRAAHEGFFPKLMDSEL